MVYEIHTYGGGDILVQILTGAKLILGSPAFTTLIGVIALLGLLIFIAYLSFSFRWEISWFLWLVIAYLGLFAPKADVAVIDHLQPGNTQVVTGVPALLGYFGHISSAVGDGLTRLMEQAFSLPGGLAFRATGYAAPLHAIQAGLNEGIPEPYVASSATQYIKNCVFYDLLDGTKLASAILKSPDLLSAFESDHPSRFTETLIAADGSEITGHPDVVKCVAGYQRLRNGMNRIYGTWWNRFVRSVSGARDLPAVDVEPVLTLSYQRLMNIAATPQEIIFQSAMIHAYDEALELQAKATGSTEELLGMTLAQAEYQQRTGLFTMGRMARHLLPALRSVVEALIYGIFPFLLLMLFLPWGYKVLQTYAVGFLWLQLWGPIFAVLNLLTAIRAEKILKPYASEGVTIMTWATLDTMTADQLAMAGAISLMVPILAYFLASGSLSGIIQGAGMVLGSSQSTAGRAASSAGMGNISMGNVGLDNFQANKFNPAVESTTGWRETVYGVMGGNAFQPARYGYVTPEGGATQLALSSLGGGISLQTGKRADLLQQESYNRTWEQAQEAFDQKATQYRDAISRTSGREARTGSEYGYTKSSEKGVSSDKGRRADIATQFADQVRREYGLSADESRDVVVRALAARSLALDGGVGFGTARLFGLGGKLGAGIVGRKEDQEQSKVGSRHQDAFNHIFDATTSEQVREAISLFERAQSSTQGRHAETASTGMREGTTVGRTEEGSSLDGVRKLAARMESLSKRMSRGDGRSVTLNQDQTAALIRHISQKARIPEGMVAATIGEAVSSDTPNITHIGGRSVAEWATDWYERNRPVGPENAELSVEGSSLRGGVNARIQNDEDVVSHEYGKIRSSVEDRQAGMGSGIQVRRGRTEDRVESLQQNVQGTQRDTGGEIDASRRRISGGREGTEQSGQELEGRVKGFQDKGVSLGRTAMEGAKDLNPLRDPSEDAISEAQGDLFEDRRDESEGKK